MGWFCNLESITSTARQQLQKNISTNKNNNSD
jgi:hypothetical protein